MTFVQSTALLLFDVRWPAWPDVLGAAIVAVFAVLGLRRGLWWQLVGCLGVIAAFAAARAAAPWLGERLHASFSALGPRGANGLAWSALFVVGLTVVALIVRIGTATLEAVHLRSIDRCGGALAGAVCGAWIHVVVIVCLGQILPEDAVSGALVGSHSERVLVAIERGIPLFLDARAAESLASTVAASTPH